MYNVFDRYKEITKINIEEFFNDFSIFITNDYPSIIDYYTGGQNVLPKNIVDNLSNLLNKASEVINSFSIYKKKLSYFFDYWELLDNSEDIKNKLETIKNSATWFRSNKTLYFNNEFENEYVLKQNQTISSLSEEIGYDNPNNDWVDIAMKNSLKEEDYTVKGGALLKISFQNNLNLQLNSVLGGISGEGVYGVDVDRTISFELNDGYYDLKVLSNKDTILQAYKILLNVTKNSVPEFPNDGINKNILGGNINSIQYPVLFRQLSDLFSKDDTFKSFQVSSIDRDRDALYIVVQAETRIGDTLKEKLEIL